MNRGFQVEPHCATTEVEVRMETELSENRIWLRAMVKTLVKGSFHPIELLACIEYTALWTAPVQFSHGPSRPLFMKRPNEVYVATFGHKPALDACGVILYALKWSRIEQLIQCGIIGQDAKGTCILRLQSCLSYSYKARPDRLKSIIHIIMAS